MLTTDQRFLRRFSFSGRISAWHDRPVIVSEPALSPDVIRAARASIDPAFLDSPQYVHDGLSARAGRPVIVKVETVNPVGSFKGRGTWLAIRALAGEGVIGADRPVVVASTGNFGQGVAHAARAHGLPAVVFAETHANPLKVARMRAFGAQVMLIGHDFDAARRGRSTQPRPGGGRVPLVDGEDPRVAAGAGTLGRGHRRGRTRQLPMPASASIPVGNGALIVGVGAWLHATPGLSRHRRAVRRRADR